LVSQLRPGTNSILDDCIRLWQVGDGAETDVTEVADWQPDQLPALRLEMTGSSGQWQNQANQRFEMLAAITLGVPGTDQGDVLDLWEAMERQLFPGDQTFYGKLELLRCNGFSVSLAGVSRRLYGSAVGQVVHGAIQLYHEIPLMN
jgi:hypothetical protein